MTHPTGESPFRMTHYAAGQLVGRLSRKGLKRYWSAQPRTALGCSRPRTAGNHCSPLGAPTAPVGSGSLDPTAKSARHRPPRPSPLRRLAPGPVLSRLTLLDLLRRVEGIVGMAGTLICPLENAEYLGPKFVPDGDRRNMPPPQRSASCLVRSSCFPERQARRRLMARSSNSRRYHYERVRGGGAESPTLTARLSAIAVEADLDAVPRSGYPHARRRDTLALPTCTLLKACAALGLSLSAVRPCRIR